ncbi:hypothetical protein NKI40_36220, partial [Mesorhizobium sp. M0643]
TPNTHPAPRASGRALRKTGDSAKLGKIQTALLGSIEPASTVLAGADYFLAVKANHPILIGEIERFSTIRSAPPPTVATRPTATAHGETTRRISTAGGPAARRTPAGVARRRDGRSRHPQKTV